MFFKKICLLFLIATSMTQYVESNPTSNYSHLWKKLTRLEKTKLTQSANKKTSIQYSGKKIKNVLAQKNLLVQIQAPQFLREGDRIELIAKIINLSDHELTGTTQLSLLNAGTNQSVDGWFKNIFPTQYFTVAVGQSLDIKFPIEIPYNFNSALKYLVTATTIAPKSIKEPINQNDSLNSSISTIKNISKSKDNIETNFSDAKEFTIPILTNRILITESFPLNIDNIVEKNFAFKKLLQSEENTSIKNQGVTVELAAHPNWSIIQSLPYLMEPVFECTEQIFNQYYANVLAMHINRITPSLKETFSKWQTKDEINPLSKTKSELLSNLQNNKELKLAILQETPWVMDAIDETTQAKNIASLFDSTKISNEIENTIQQLIELQRPSGAFSLSKGGPEDWQLTQYIITGIGRLIKLNAIENKDYQNIKIIVDKAISHLDKKVFEEYKQLLKNKTIFSKNNLRYATIHYLYLRSFFQEYPLIDSIKIAQNYFLRQAKKYWPVFDKNSQAMIALALNKTNEKATAKAIIQSLKQNAINNKQLGMYWKEWNTSGYTLHWSPVESQSIMIEAFFNIDENSETINELKLWLLQQKNIHHWNTSKATAAASYAMLLVNQKNETLKNLLPSRNDSAIISLGGKKIGGFNLNAQEIAFPTDAYKMKSDKESGYFKYSIEAEKVTPSMGNISISVKTGDTKFNTYKSWGAVYWQYFEDLDKIDRSESPLKLNKQIFVEKNSDKGIILLPIKEVANLQVGDKIKVRLQIQANQDIEYLDLKDQRAACLVTIGAKNRYQSKGSWGYFQSNGEASTHFFIDRLSKGRYVIEFEQLVIHPGNFSNGISSIQSMNSPEFISYSDEFRMVVENQK